ncbi:MAG: hypothetical protein P8X90_08285 [Desulfobacterales bacterium]|jgi:hypothetical protein
MWYNEDESTADRAFFYDSKGKLYLDKFGFPEMAVANSILLNLENYGESREDLEENWGKWIHHIPFDAPVAGALAKLYNQRLEKINQTQHPADYQRLKRKLDLVQQRAARYSIDLFAGADRTDVGEKRPEDR